MMKQKLATLLLSVSILFSMLAILNFPLANAQGTTTLYFRSDLNTNQNITGFPPYLLNDSNTDNALSQGAIFGSTFPVDIHYGIRVWVLHGNGSNTELTSSVWPYFYVISDISNQVNFTGIKSNNWTVPEANLAGGDMIKVNLGLESGNAGWFNVSSFVSPPVTDTHLNSQTWNFSLSISQTVLSGGQSCYFKWGNSTTPSTISNISLTFQSSSPVVDDTPPTISNITISSFTDLHGSISATFYAYFNDDVALKSYLFQENFSIPGTWRSFEGAGWRYFTATPSWVSLTGYFPRVTDNQTYGYRWIANDTSDNQVDSGILSFTVYGSATSGGGVAWDSSIRTQQ